MNNGLGRKRRGLSFRKVSEDPTLDDQGNVLCINQVFLMMLEATVAAFLYLTTDSDNHRILDAKVVIVEARS